MPAARTITICTPALFGRVRAVASVDGESVSLSAPTLHVDTDQPPIAVEPAALHRHGRFVGGSWRSLHTILSELALQEAYA